MSALQRAEYMRKLREGCGRSAVGAADLSRRWDGSVPAQLTHDHRPHIGTLELLTSHLLLVADGSLLYALAISEIQSIQRKRELHFATRTFAEAPRIRTVLDVETATGVVSVSLEGDRGAQLGKAIEIHWRWIFGYLAPRELAMFRSFAPPDVLYALSLLPLDIECTLAQRIVKSTVTAIDRPAVLRIDEAFGLSVIMRPGSFAEMSNLQALRMDLDEGELIYAKGDEIRVIDSAGRIMLFSNVFDAAATVPLLNSVFLANAATMVYRHLRLTKALEPFTYEEANKLLQQYAVVDDNLDGAITRSEFVVSLGPILGAEPMLIDALYHLFDCFNIKLIRVFEYLHGARVLLRGDVDDRLTFVFGLFDTSRQGIISKKQFMDGVRALHQTVTIKVPRGDTSDDYAATLYERLDAEGTGQVAYGEFREILAEQLGITDAIRSITLPQGGEASKALASNPQRIISFGHSQWHEISHIMSGIQRAVETADQTPLPTLPLDPMCFATKVSFNTSTGAVVGFKQSGFKKLTGGPATVTFNDYAPQAFAAVRRQFGVTKDSYLTSLGITQLKHSLMLGGFTSLFEMSSSGRSGSFFYSSHDGRYILKTLPEAEAAAFRKILPVYLGHVTQNPDTLLTRFMGLHAIIRGSLKMYFVVMANIFQNKLPVHETFDLKGSTVNRTTPMELRSYGVALKDNDFGDRRLPVLPSLKADLVKQVTADSAFLAKLNFIDYSFLLGVHSSENPLPPPDPSQSPRPLHSKFQLFHGGIPTASKTEVLYVGIIDVLTNYNLKKKGETLGKSVLYDSNQVSCMAAKPYQERFVKYIDTIFVEVDAKEVEQKKRKHQ